MPALRRARGVVMCLVVEEWLASFYAIRRDSAPREFRKGSACIAVGQPKAGRLERRSQIVAHSALTHPRRPQIAGLEPRASLPFRTRLLRHFCEATVPANDMPLTRVEQAPVARTKVSAWTGSGSNPEPAMQRFAPLTHARTHKHTHHFPHVLEPASRWTLPRARTSAGTCMGSCLQGCPLLLIQACGGRPTCCGWLRMHLLRVDCWLLSRERLRR